MFQSLGSRTMSMANIIAYLGKYMYRQKKGRLTIQCDEMWSFVGNKDNKQWIWLALDVATREIVGVYVGDRSGDGAQGLWDALVSFSEGDLIIFQEVRESHWCYLAFCSSLQCILTSLGLPNLGY